MATENNTTDPHAEIKRFLRRFLVVKVLLIAAIGVYVWYALFR